MCENLVRELNGFSTAISQQTLGTWISLGKHVHISAAVMLVCEHVHKRPFRKLTLTCDYSNCRSARPFITAVFTFMHLVFVWIRIWYNNCLLQSELFAHVVQWHIGQQINYGNYTWVPQSAMRINGKQIETFPPASPFTQVFSRLLERLKIDPNSRVI